MQVSTYSSDEYAINRYNIIAQECITVNHEISRNLGKIKSNQMWKLDNNREEKINNVWINDIIFVFARLQNLGSFENIRYMCIYLTFSGP